MSHSPNFGRPKQGQTFVVPTFHIHFLNPECIRIPWVLAPVLKINDHATGGRRTKDILGGPKGWGPKKKGANVEIYVIFEVFALCGGRTKTDFKDRAALSRNGRIAV